MEIGRFDDFYATKYFKAFPALLHGLNPDYPTLEACANMCYYSLRTFDRFLKHFGLVDIREEGKGLSNLEYIRKTEMMDQLVKVGIKRGKNEPHK